MTNNPMQCALEAAIHCNDHAGVKLAHEAGAVFQKHYTSMAARAGSVGVMAYLHENGAPWDLRTTSSVCGSLSIDWADGNETQKPSKLCNFDCLKYAHEHGCPWDPDTTSNAAGRCNLDCLVYAHEHGCPWHPSTCLEAARGSYDCMKYAHEHGAPWPEDVIDMAASCGYVDCLQYADENGAEFSTDAMSLAACAGHLKCLQYCHKVNKLAVLRSMRRASKHDRLDCLLFLIERNGMLDVRCLKRHRETVLLGLDRRRGAITIQRMWRKRAHDLRQAAVSKIEDAYTTWACRPDGGAWFIRSKQSFENLSYVS